MLGAITSIGLGIVAALTVAIVSGFLFPALAPDFCFGVGLAAGAHIAFRRCRVTLD